MSHLCFTAKQVRTTLFPAFSCLLGTRHMYFSLLITRHSKHLLVKFQVPVGMETIQKACIWPGKEWLIGNGHMLGCKTFSLSQQGRVYPRLRHSIILLLHLHTLQLPTDHQSKALCHRNPTFLRPYRCRVLFSSSDKSFSISEHAQAWFHSTNCQTGYKHHHLELFCIHPVWPALLRLGLNHK